jgi:hypothetical protein
MGFEDFKLEKIAGKHVAVSVTFTIIGRLLAKVGGDTSSGAIVLNN